MANPDQKARIGALAEAQARRNQGAEIQAAREIFPLVDEFRTNDIDVSTIASVLHDIGDHAKKTGEDNARVVAVAAGSTPAEIAAAVAAAVPTLVFATEPPAH